MKLHRIAISILLLSAVSCSTRKTTTTTAKGPAPSRSFDFTYTVHLPSLPRSIHMLRVWIPVATSDQHQTVRLLKMTGTIPLHLTKESEYGDTIAYAEAQRPRFRKAAFTLTYRVKRDGYSVGSFKQLMTDDRTPVQVTPMLARFLEPDRLIPIDGEIKQVADDAAAGKHGEIEKAHAIYNYVFHHMKYEKTGTGWGHGNALWACNAHHGNCTDFHSLFIGMMRAEHIPARFVIGFPIPPDKSKGVIPGYHCWAEFYVTGKGWVPVDISEAWLTPSKYNFYFGSIDPNRVRFSAGRDIILDPKQSGAPVNYFVYPYVELNGKPYDRVENHFSFRDTSR